MTDRYREVNGVKQKRCSTCKEYFDLTNEFFSNRKASSDGFAYSCKKCERAVAARSYQKRKQKHKARQRYQENREEYLERAKERYEENKDEILEQQREWRKSEKGRELTNEASRRRRERIKEQTPEGRNYVREEIIKRDSIFGECICQICGEPINLENGELEIDHIIPIAAGGSDTQDNVRCTHKVCNATRPKDGRDIEAI